MKNILKSVVFIVVAFCATNAWAGATATRTVSVNVPTQAGGLSVVISKVTGTVWNKDQPTINFGTLVWSPTDNIFTSDSYYAVDIGVADNSGANWTITHTRTSLAKGTSNLDDKVNVAFNKQTTAILGTELSKYSFGNSNGKTFTKAQLAGAWLRIYYGIGTGDPGAPDAAGVTPIGLDTPAGTYTGSITITLTP